MSLAEDIRVKPDYRTPTHEVFFNIAQPLILKHRNLDVLFFSRSSWMVDFASKFRTDAELLGQVRGCSQKVVKLRGSQISQMDANLKTNILQ